MVVNWHGVCVYVGGILQRGIHMRSINSFSFLLFWGAMMSPQATAGDRPQRGVSMALGAGLGPSHGLVGQVLEVHFRRADGLGVSLDAGAGLYASGGLSRWSPGQNIR